MKRKTNGTHEEETVQTPNLTQQTKNVTPIRSVFDSSVRNDPTEKGSAKRNPPEETENKKGRKGFERRGGNEQSCPSCPPCRRGRCSCCTEGTTRERRVRRSSDQVKGSNNRGPKGGLTRPLSSAHIPIATPPKASTISPHAREGRRDDEKERKNGPAQPRPKLDNPPHKRSGRHPPAVSPPSLHASWFPLKKKDRGRSGLPLGRRRRM